MKAVTNVTIIRGADLEGNDEEYLSEYDDMLELFIRGEVESDSVVIVNTVLVNE